MAVRVTLSPWQRTVERFVLMLTVGKGLTDTFNPADVAEHPLLVMVSVYVPLLTACAFKICGLACVELNPLAPFH